MKPAYAWLVVLAACVFLNSNCVTAQEPQTQTEFQPAPGFQSLFNGKDLTGWNYLPTTDQQKKQHARWKKNKPDTAPPWPVYDSVVDFAGKTKSDDGRFVALNGTIVVTVPPEGRKLQMLYTKKEFTGDFTLRLQFKAAKGADSGVFIKGKQLQCRDYPNAGPYKKLKNFRAEDWNDLVVVAKGNTAYCTCNGEVLEAEMMIPESGPIGFEGDHGKLEYRNIEIGPAPTDQSKPPPSTPPNPSRSPSAEQPNTTIDLLSFWANRKAQSALRTPSLRRKNNQQATFTPSIQGNL